MSEESTLSLSHKLSPEIQNKLQQLAGKPDTTKSELPKIDNTNTKVDNNKTNRPNKSKLSQEVLVNYIQIVLMKHPSLLPSVLIRQ